MANYPLATLQARVALGVQRSDVAAASNNYADFINEAIEEFTHKRAWISQRKTVDVIIQQGETSIGLPDDFKELQPRNSNNSPISYVLNDPNNPGAVFPVDVTFESQEIRRLWVFGGQVAVWYGNMRIFLKRDENGSFIGLETPAPEDLTFRVDYIADFVRLSSSIDSNPLAEDHPNMIIAQAKAYALASVNDPTAVALQQQADLDFRTAAHDDARKDLQGRDLHM